jgi:hypothetical protein
VNPMPLVRDVASIVYAFGAEGRHFMLFGEDVGVEVDDPQLALLRHAKVAEGVANVGAHHRPEEFRIRGPERRRAGVTELLVHPRFLEFRE